MDDARKDTAPGMGIVSSEHLAKGKGWQLSEVEFGLIVAYNGFARWVNRCMAAAGKPDLSTLEILILHNITHRGRPKRLADVCFMLNIEDTHTVNYAVKKLKRHGLVEGHRQGKEMFWQATEAGVALCRKYREVREKCLIEGLGLLDDESADLHQIATTLRALSGLYDQAARAASSL